MTELILHIGMHKTGSTSIQATLNNFDNGKIRYARLSDVNHSIPLYTLFSENRNQYAVHTSLGLTEADISGLTQQIRQQLDDELAMERQTLILSGEDVSLIEPDGVKSMADYFKARVESVRVLAYVRDPVGFASSALQQYIQGGKQEPVIPDPEYVNRFKKFIDCFGRDAVEFVVLDRNTLHDGSVIADFCHRAGIEAAEITEIQKNSSISLECAQLIYLFNNSGLPSSGNAVLAQSRLVFMHRLSIALDGPSFKIPSDWVRQCMNVEDVRWMEDVSGLTLIDRIKPTPAVAEEVDPLCKLQDMLTAIGQNTIDIVKQKVGLVDCNFTRSDDLTSLLNVLFMATYFETLATLTPAVHESVSSEPASSDSGLQHEYPASSDSGLQHEYAEPDNPHSDAYQAEQENNALQSHG